MYKETFLSACMFHRLSQMEIFIKLTSSLKKVTVQSYQDPDQNLVGWMFDDFLQCPSPWKILQYKEGHFILSGGGTSLMTINNGCSLIRLELTGTCNYTSNLRHNITHCFNFNWFNFSLTSQIVKQNHCFLYLVFKHNEKCLNCLSI